MDVINHLGIPKGRYPENVVSIYLKNDKLREDLDKSKIECESLEATLKMKNDNIESLKGKLNANSEIISKFKNDVTEYQKKSEERRKEMYLVNISLQETLLKKEEEITELENKIKMNDTSESKFSCNDCSEVI